MSKKKFTIEDIDNFLEELGFVWNEHLIYNSKKRNYETLSRNTFNGKPTFLSLKNLNNKHKYFALVEISDEVFTLSINNNRLDASDSWQEFLAEKTKCKVYER